MKNIPPRPRNAQKHDSLLYNIELLVKLIDELKVSSLIFSSRVSEITTRRKQHWKKLNISPAFTFTTFSYAESNVEINVTFKSFVFIVRQAFEKLFRILYQSREELGYLNVKHVLPDLSRSGNFGKYFGKLLDYQYDYDQDIIEFIKSWKSEFITTRILRNAIKTQASYNMELINDSDFKIVCTLLQREMNDKSLLLLDDQIIQRGEQVSKFKIQPHYLDICIKLLCQFVELILRKIDTTKLDDLDTLIDKNLDKTYSEFTMKKFQEKIRINY